MTEENLLKQSKKHLFNPKLKLLLIIGLVTLVIILTQDSNLPEYLHRGFIWVKSLGWLAPVAFIIIYNLATLLFIPGSILTIKGGCLFGVFWGSLYVLMGAMLGAIFAFVIGRYLSRDWISRQISSHPKFQVIDEAVTREGWKIVLLSRLSPVLPFNLLNYAFGITQVSLRDYILGSLGIIPATVVYVYIGSLVTDLTVMPMATNPITRETQIMQGITQIVGAIATIALIFYTARLIAKIK